MASMKKSQICALALALLAGLPASASEQEMNEALSRWDQVLSEYQAALESAESDEARAAVTKPDGSETAAALWRSVSRKTGTRVKQIKRAQTPSLDAGKEESRRVPTYEFEERWALPAVIWLLNHPNEFASLFKGHEEQLVEYVEAMLDSIEEVHYASPAMTQICPLLAETPGVRHYDILLKIYQHNPDANARGSAAMGLSIQLGSPLVSGTVGSPQQARSYRIYYLKQAVTLTDDDLMFGPVSLSAVAQEQAYCIRNLSVGSIPPPVTLETLAGQQVRFPAQRKACLLFFWLPGEDVGTNIVAKQEALARQYPNLVFYPVTVKPSDAAQFRSDLTQLGVTDTYTDNDGGAAASAYRIKVLPTAVLVDENARIRYIGYPDIKLQVAMDEMFRPEKGRAVVLPAAKEDGAAPQPQPEDEVIIQPGSRPAPTPPAPEDADAAADADDAADESGAPPLREMPEF